MSKIIKYKCLALDHDDTAVDSSRTLHFPSHMQAMKELRPDYDVGTLDNWFIKNDNPGILKYLKDELCLSDEELDYEYKLWEENINKKKVDFFPGLKCILEEYKKLGGKIVVVSHGHKKAITKHYNDAFGHDFVDLIFSGNDPKEHQKPSTYPLKKIQSYFNIKPQDIVVVDDLRFGIEMAVNGGVDAVAALWAHNIPQIRGFMKKNCVALLDEVTQLEKILFNGGIYANSKN